MKPSASVFALAAQFQFESGEPFAIQHGASKYSCDNVNKGAETLGRKWGGRDLEFYQKMFEPEEYSFAWWPLLDNGEWDHESRILALLLAAEMLRKPSRK